MRLCELQPRATLNGNSRRQLADLRVNMPTTLRTRGKGVPANDAEPRDARARRAGLRTPTRRTHGPSAAWPSPRSSSARGRAGARSRAVERGAQLVRRPRRDAHRLRAPSAHVIIFSPRATSRGPSRECARDALEARGVVDDAVGRGAITRSIASISCRARFGLLRERQRMPAEPHDRALADLDPGRAHAREPVLTSSAASSSPSRSQSISSCRLGNTRPSAGPNVSAARREPARVRGRQVGAPEAARERRARSRWPRNARGRASRTRWIRRVRRAGALVAREPHALGALALVRLTGPCGSGRLIGVVSGRRSPARSPRSADLWLARAPCRIHGRRVLVREDDAPRRGRSDHPACARASATSHSARFAAPRSARRRPGARPRCLP